ncbi:hypothetical protein GEV29_15310 [Aeromicrobium sp. SMF47]|uniref:Uncharacterized protein n=1 Tax=Aeromicrobium yanjiei TaxID=2662028 RepID=A0A5Q2MEF1_9ACTN|nr:MULTISPECIES: hypothetical protein [Aeromicrobium]MRJ77910.1 hypothetical protein [Aeromicrobium yanjiei]MRK02270.1 hypothetical protein [Aeromicrobium sp. S22]QGG41008.1 hypothetical protein GEV26_06330 [Aeromicrobium yanjiei]
MALSRREIVKDVLQQSTEAAIGSAGHVVAILFDTARQITREVGAFGTEIFEIAEASKRANEDVEDTHPAAG